MTEIFNEQQTKMLKQAFEQYDDVVCNGNTVVNMPQTAEFSKKHQNKMNRIIKMQDRFYYGFFNTALKRAACIVGAVVIGATALTFGVKAIREPLLNITKTETKPSQLFENREDADVQKQIVINNKKINLTYYNTSYMTDDDYVNVYTDENGVIYGFDKNNTFVEFMDSRIEKNSKNDGHTAIGQKKAVEIANTHLKKQFSDISKHFEQTQCLLNNGTYIVAFERKYGGFVTGETVNVYVCSNGEIFRWAARYFTTFEDFDDSLLEGITQKELVDFAKKNLKTNSGYTADEYTLKSIRLKKKDTNFIIEICMSDPQANEQNIYYAL